MSLKGVGVPVNMHAVIYYMHFIRYPYSFIDYSRLLAGQAVSDKTFVDLRCTNFLRYSVTAALERANNRPQYFA